LEEKKLIQLKKSCFEKNRQLKMMIASKKESKLNEPPKDLPAVVDDVVVLDDADDYNDDDLSIVSISDPAPDTKRHQVVTIKKPTVTALPTDKSVSIIQKIRNTNIIRKLPKDLTISKTASPEGLQIERKVSMIEKLGNMKNITTKRKRVSGSQQEDGEPVAKIVTTKMVGETLITRKNKPDGGAVGDVKCIQLDSDSDGEFGFMNDPVLDDFLNKVDDKK
jgi:hypothetical protein